MFSLCCPLRSLCWWTGAAVRLDGTAVLLVCVVMFPSAQGFTLKWCCPLRGASYTLSGLCHHFGWALEYAGASKVCTGPTAAWENFQGQPDWRVMIHRSAWWRGCSICKLWRVLVPAGVYMSRLRDDGDEHQLLCSWRILPTIPSPPTHALSLINKSPFLIPQMSFKLLLLCCISVELFVVLSL